MRSSRQQQKKRQKRKQTKTQEQKNLKNYLSYKSIEMHYFSFIICMTLCKIIVSVSTVQKPVKNPRVLFTN